MVNLFLFLLIVFPFEVHAGKKVVVVLSENTELKLKDGKSFTTGNYLNEFSIPLMKWMEKGFEPIFYTPTGKLPALDQDSVKVSYFKQDQKYFEKAQGLFHSIGTQYPINALTKEAEIDLEQVAIIFVPGGHAPMNDLISDPNLGQLLRRGHQKRIVTALICHGPIAILSALKGAKKFTELLSVGKEDEAILVDTNWIYRGYSMTIFSNEEEKVAEKSKLKGEMRFYPADALEAAGGKNVSAKLWQSHVVVDRELITAQNPNSVDEFAEKVLGATTP